MGDYLEIADNQRILALTLRAIDRRLPNGLT